MRLRIASTIVFVVISLFSLAAHGEGVKVSAGVVFLPFDARDGGSYTVLKDGLRNMLAGRLAAKEGIFILENSLSVEEQKRFLNSSPSESTGLFNKLGTDYIATGTMLARERDFLLQVDFYPKNGSRPISVTMHVDNEQKIIEGIDVLAQRIAEKVFGHKPSQSTDKKVSSKSEGIEAFRTEHPDRKYKKEVVSGSALVVSSSDNSISQADLKRRKSGLPAGITAMAVGDGDGDGENEIFIASQKDLRIYHYERAVLKQLAFFVFPPSLKVVGLNVADFDGDGSVEIYLSALTQDRYTSSNDLLSSSILTWSPTAGIQQKVKNIRWVIRPVLVPGEGLVLAGQAKGKRLVGTSYLEAGIYKLKKDADSKGFSRGQKLFLPKGVDIFDFVIADIDGDGVAEKVAITDTMKMAVYDQENSLVWISEGDFGGSPNYLGQRFSEQNAADKRSNWENDKNFAELKYIPTRLIATDINNDGKVDIISSKNTLSTFRLLTNLRGFNGGNVVCMGWDGTKMSEMWASDKLSGYIADYSFVNNVDNSIDRIGRADDDHGNRVKLYVGQVPNDSFANFLSITGVKGNLVAYEFNIIDKSTTAEDHK